jgi:hypothetical protein
MKKLLSIMVALLLCASPALAQNAGTVTNHAFALGKGAGVTGYTSLLCASAQLAVGQAAADPICQTISGDVTITAGGVTAIGTNKVTNAQFRQSGALSLVGRSANSTGNVADISATPASSCVFLESSSTLTCALIATANIAASAVTYAKIQNVTAARLLGNPTGGAAAPSEISLGATLAFSGSALQTVAMTGDVTSSANAFATTIAANAVTNAKMATMAANTVKANATAGAAIPTDFAMPSCSSASNALIWTTSTGFGCNSIAGGGSGTANSFPGGRLTLTSGVAITTADVTAAPIVYYAPSTGIYVPIYNGSTVSGSQFTASTTDAVGLSTTLGSSWTTNTNYDWFVGLNSSTVTMCSGPAWTSDSARGTGAGTTELQILNGLWTNKNSMTCRYGNATTFTCAANQCTYVGSMRTVAAGQAEDSLVKRFIWNAYNQAQREMKRVDTTPTWNYSTASFRQANGSTSNQMEFFLGLSGGQVEGSYTATVSSSTGTPRPVNVSVALDSTSAITDGTVYLSPTSTLFITNTHIYRGLPAIGYHKLVALEQGGGTDTQTWYGGDSFRLYGNLWN